MKMNQTTNDDLFQRKLLIEERKKESERLLSKFKYIPPIRPQKSSTLPKKNAATLPIIIIPKIKKKQYNNVVFNKKKKNYNDSMSHTIGNSKKEAQKGGDANNKPISFSRYLQMQTLAEMNIKPGRNMTEKLLNHIDKIGVIRKKVMERELEPISALKGRYNDENPEDDTKIELVDKALIEHKWKNSFCLSEYQNFFLDELKGKISSLNYRVMLKKFRQIARMCFSKGVVNLGNINHMLNQE